MKDKNVREGDIVFKINVLDISLEEESPENFTPVFVWIFFFFFAMLASMICSQTNSFAEFQVIIIICVSEDLFIYNQLLKSLKRVSLSSTDNCSHILLNMLSACMFLRASFSGKEHIISFYLPLSLLAFKGCEYTNIIVWIMKHLFSFESIKYYQFRLCLYASETKEKNPSN